MFKNFMCWQIQIMSEIFNKTTRHLLEAKQIRIASCLPSFLC